MRIWIVQLISLVCMIAVSCVKIHNIYMRYVLNVADGVGKKQQLQRLTIISLDIDEMQKISQMLEM